MVTAAKPVPYNRWRVLGYSPTQWALDNVHSRPERYIAGVTSRQVGKTWCAAIEIDEAMSRPEDEHGLPWVGLIAPTYGHCDLVVNRYLEYLTRAFGRDAFKYNQNKHLVTITDPKAGTPGARLQWISADDPLYSMGFTFSKLLFDESQRVSDAVFTKARPTVGVRGGEIRAFGTPDINPEQSWFKAMWLLGQEDDQPEYHSFTVSCMENKFMPDQEILDAKSQVTEREFRMLYLGEWVDEEGSFFTNVENAVIPFAPEYNPKARHVMGVDFAIVDDYNAVFVGETATRTVVHKARWNKTDPLLTYDRIADIWERYGHPLVVADETGLGRAMIPELRERGMRVVGVNFSPSNKLEIYGKLAADIEHRRIMFPDSWHDVIRELKGFVYQKTPSGRLTAAAAAGYHDDMVTALALLNEGFHARGGASRQAQYSYLPSRESELERLMEMARA